jgi:tetratricopeptide (TPR) repeat protein
MPQHLAPKLVKIGARGTSHRITKNDDEPVPHMDTPQTTPDPKTGLILVNSDAADAQDRLPREVLLRGYQGALARDQSREDLAEHYKNLLQAMTGDQSSEIVLSALAGAELAKRTSEGDREAIKDLSKAVALNSKFPKDYLLLAELNDRDGNLGEAIRVLSLAIERFPYTPAPYESLVACYQRAGDTAKASEILRRGLELFPADKNLLQLEAGQASRSSEEHAPQPTQAQQIAGQN